MGADALPAATPASSRPDLWLRLARALPSTQAIALLDRLGGLDSLLELPANGLRDVMPARIADALRSDNEPEDIRTALAWLEQEHCHLLTWLDPDYPPLLREIPDPPLVLFVHGDRAALSQPQIAIVGSRHATAGGEATARDFAEVLAQSGLVITSGLALGIDAAAHRGALAAGGRTIAVAGTGLDRVYPAIHRDLAHSIVAQGALVSEYPLGTPPRREHFPQRNRLISGMGLGVLVVEAAVRSGSLITARLAGEQGREVFAIPGSIHSPQARGCHALIRQGAKLVETAVDVLEELHWSGAPGRETKNAQEPLNEMDALTSKLWNCLGYDPIDVDTLVNRSGLTADCISSILLLMELRGLVEARPGGRYLRTSFRGGR